MYIEEETKISVTSSEIFIPRFLRFADDHLRGKKLNVSKFEGREGDD